jgi:uncharacterized membrane protein YcaP (DUF421 family)
MTDMQPLIAVALRVTVMYLYTLAVLRVSGKRSVGNLTGPDVVSTIIIGDMFDDLVWAELALSKGIAGITTIVTLHLLTNVLEWRSPTIERVLDGSPVLVALNGAFVKRGLLRERVAEHEVRELLRVQGVDDLSDVREGRIEVDGGLSVMRFDERKRVRARDVTALREVVT